MGRQAHLRPRAKAAEAVAAAKRNQQRKKPLRKNLLRKRKQPRRRAPVKKLAAVLAARKPRKKPPRKKAAARRNPPRKRNSRWEFSSDMKRPRVDRGLFCFVIVAALQPAIIRIVFSTRIFFRTGYGPLQHGNPDSLSLRFAAQ